VNTLDSASGSLAMLDVSIQKLFFHGTPNDGVCAGFIDPLFSSGIHLALTSALSAAASICAAVKGDCTEFEAGEWHTQRVITSYTRSRFLTTGRCAFSKMQPYNRFQLVVLSAYKQIRAQQLDILSDIDEDGFDRVFALFRPGSSRNNLLTRVRNNSYSPHSKVIQGASDMGIRLSEVELQRALDFCVRLFDPTTPEQHARLEAKGNEAILGNSRLGELLDLRAPILDPGIWETGLGELHKNEPKNG
jgi:flavine halogenase